MFDDWRKRERERERFGERGGGGESRDRVFNVVFEKSSVEEEDVEEEARRYND